MDAAAGEAVMAPLADKRIGVVGRHPDGFDTCRYDGDALARLTGGVEPKSRCRTCSTGLARSTAK